jgi:hypothetical protein
MDLTQTKLSKAEWASVEVPVSDTEEQVLRMIIEGFANPDIRKNTTTTLSTVMKVIVTDGMEFYLYKEYFESNIRGLCSDKHPALVNWFKTIGVIKPKPINKADQIRISNVKTMIESQRNTIFEYVLIEFCSGVLGKSLETTTTSAEKEGSKKSKVSGNSKSTKDTFNKARHPSGFYLYSLVQFQQTSILSKVNKYVREFVEVVVRNALPGPESPEMIREVFMNAGEYIEKNAHLIRHEDQTLYSHQKTLFRAIDTNPHIAKLILYMAPTGTGKTLSPIGISQKYRVIFVCVARHVGLALAKSAISVDKKVAFAFGCETASDIRLHYYAAKEYKINKRSGGIGKVDNSVGDKVEIMICDVASYIVAMRYMMAFNEPTSIVTFWDEPTITMDDTQNPLHELIHRNWCENRIPKMVLSCATLPKLVELTKTLNDFKFRFVSVDEETEEVYDPEIITIDSYECKKSITLLNKEGKCVLPHLLFDNYRDILRCAEHCESNKTLLRYFDVREIVRFVSYLESIGQLQVLPKTYFKNAYSITMNHLKQYYIKVLCSISSEHWTEIHTHLTSTLPVYFNPPVSTYQSSSLIRKIQSVDSVKPAGPISGDPIKRATSVSTQPLSIPATAAKNTMDGVLLTTKDAHTLTDGPTIFLAEDVDKIGRFYIQQSNIPDAVISNILSRIENNNTMLRRIENVERQIADKSGESNAPIEKGKEKHKDKTEKDPELKRMMEQIEQMREQISSVSLSSIYVPNSKPHQDIWLPSGKSHVANAFIPNIGEADVREIMETSVDNQRKLLLILGIGVFAQGIDTKYAEVMKRLAYEQQLFMIIASSDYIYGTNYQFCHGFIGKDLTNMTQQKTIQAIGRIGRNNIQNEYTVRFRDDAILRQLFCKMEHNPEAVVMSRLFCSREDDEDQ